MQSGYLRGQDSGEFDAICDHLIVEHTGGQVVGTYRLQTGRGAKTGLGYYSEREFDFMPYQTLREQMVELGRACIHREHRSTDVLYLLWRGIARYAMDCGARYLIGCSSLTSQDPALGTAVYDTLRPYEAEPVLRTEPKPYFAMPLVRSAEVSGKVPKLLRAYLAIGARICGPPAIDRSRPSIFLRCLICSR